MGSEWPGTRLDEVTELIVDCPHSTPKWTDEGVSVLRSNNIKNGRLDLSKPSFTTEAGYQERIKRTIPETNDLVLTREAPMGEVCKIPEGLHCCLGQRMVLIRTKKILMDSTYLLYALQSPYLKHQISWNEGTGTTVSNIRIPNIKAFKIPTPSLPEQKTIAHILGSLDDKIELNRQMNKTLESMAQALFKSWFVDFDPVIDNALAAGNPIPDVFAERAEQRRSIKQQKMEGVDSKNTPNTIQTQFPSEFEYTEDMGWIPKGWEVGNVSDLFELHRGFDLSTAKRLKGQIPVYSAGGIHGTHNEYKIKPPGIITGRSGVIGNVFLSLTPFWPLNTTLYIREFRNCGAYYAFNFLKNIDLSIYNSGSAVPSLNRNFVHSTSTFIPNDKILEVYELQADSLFRKIKGNDKENVILDNLRDTLLPKLLSGELRVESMKF